MYLHNIVFALISAMKMYKCKSLYGLMLIVAFCLDAGEKAAIKYEDSEIHTVDDI